MRKLPFILLALATLTVVATSCFKDDDPINGKYADWRKANEAWLLEQTNLIDQKTGHNYYTPITAPWDNNAKVYIHWFNDTMETKDNLKPLYTSQVDVKYKVTLYDGTPVDSSSLRTSPAPGVYRTRLNSGVIEGWPIAISRMHVGDTCRVLLPHNVAYGSTGSGNLVKPFSTLIFYIKLMDIPKYEH